MRDIPKTIWGKLHGSVQWELLRLVHPQFLIGVFGVVQDENSDVLLQRNRFWTEGSWGLPGGYAKRREKLENTLVREVREESGLEVEVGKFLRIKSGFIYRIESFYEARVVGGKLQPNPREVHESRFFPMNQLPDGTTEITLELIEQVRNSRKEKV